MKYLNKFNEDNEEKAQSILNPGLITDSCDDDIKNEKSKKLNENLKLYDNDGVFIEPVASSSDFSKFIDKNNFKFKSGEFWDNMDMWTDGNISGRFSKEWCNSVISGKAGKYWKDKKIYYPAVLKLLEVYKLETIRFVCDW